MINLPNGCRCSEFSVVPSNWQTKAANLKEKWYVYYRFYDPPPWFVAHEPFPTLP
jgi:hypothetical protein